VIANAARIKREEFSRNFDNRVVSTKNVTVEDLQNSLVNNQKYTEIDHDTIKSSQPSLDIAHKTHSQNVKKRHAFDVNPFHKESK